MFFLHVLHTHTHLFNKKSGETRYAVTDSGCQLSPGVVEVMVDEIALRAQQLQHSSYVVNIGFTHSFPIGAQILWDFLQIK